MFEQFAEQCLSEAMDAKPPIEEIRTKHAVLTLPTPCMLGGLNVTARAFASLPRKVVAGKSSTAFTRFVVVGHSERGGEIAGVTLGDHICGGPGFTDKEAVRFLRTVVAKKLGSGSPEFLKCKKVPASCPTRSNPSVEHPLTWLSALTGRSLPGRALPIMMQTQSPELGVALGDALAMLTASGGVWEAERVLFVFAADFSTGLPADRAKICDEHTLQVLTGQGVPQTVRYFADLWAGKAHGGDCGPEALPRSYASLVAAERVASGLGLAQSRYEVKWMQPPRKLVGVRIEETKEDAQDVVGYGSVMFWKDGGLPSEKLAAQKPPTR